MNSSSKGVGGFSTRPVMLSLQNSQRGRGALRHRHPGKPPDKE